MVTNVFVIRRKQPDRGKYRSGKGEEEENIGHFVEDSSTDEDG